MSPSVDNLWTNAMEEAITYANSSDVILHTIELRNPLILPDTAIRCVLDHGDLLEFGDPDIYGHLLGLEADAPFEGGATKPFVACMFDMSLPSQQDNPPTIELTLDNVTQLITEQLDVVVSSGAPIEVSYREYLASDKTQPQFVLHGGILQRVISTNTRVRGTITFADLQNRNFPGLLYRPNDFPGLAR